MQSLTDLNNRAAQTVTFTENRGTNVIFDRVVTKDYSFTETQLSFNILIGANIIEIINPSIANVRLKINLGNTLATITYGDQLPSGVTFTKSGSVYTFFGITSVAIWDALKTLLVVNIDASYAGNFSYEVEFLYNTDTAANVSFSYNVGIYVPTSLLEVQTSIACGTDLIKSTTIQLDSFYFISRFNAIFATTVVMDSEFGMTTDGEIRTTFEPAEYQITANLQTTPNYRFDNNVSMSSTSTMSCSATKTEFITGLPSTLSYNSNEFTNIFSSVTVNPNATAGVTIHITPSVGHTQLTDATSRYYSDYVTTRTGASSVKDALEDLKYYPPYNYTGSGTIQVVIEYDNIIVKNFNISLSHNTVGSITTRYASYTNASSPNAAPSISEFLYGEVDYYMVGAGGAGGQTTAGGGGASGVYETGSFTPSTVMKLLSGTDSTGIYNAITNVNATVGAGGGPHSSLDDGLPGDDSILTYTNTSNNTVTITATGGDGGLGGGTNSANSSSNGGSNDDYSGGIGWSAPPLRAGGGGAGASFGGSNSQLNAGIYYGGAGGSGTNLPTGFTQILIGIGGDGASTTEGSGTQETTAGCGGNGTNDGKDGGIFMKFSAR